MKGGAGPENRKIKAEEPAKEDNPARSQRLPPLEQAILDAGLPSKHLVLPKSPKATYDQPKLQALESAHPSSQEPYMALAKETIDLANRTARDNLERIDLLQRRSTQEARDSPPSKPDSKQATRATTGDSSPDKKPSSSDMDCSSD